MAQREKTDNRPRSSAGNNYGDYHPTGATEATDYGREVQQEGQAGQNQSQRQQTRDYDSAQMGGFGDPADYGNDRPAYTPQNAFGGNNVSLGAQQAHFGPQQASGWPATRVGDPDHLHYDHGNLSLGAIEGPWDERSYAAGHPAFTPNHERPPVQHQQPYQPGQIHGGAGERADYPAGHGMGSGVHHRFSDQAPTQAPQGGFESSHYYGNQQPQNRHAAGTEPSPVVTPAKPSK
jgi:hypothetical protein